MPDSNFTCLNKSCSVSGDTDRMICCWLCQGLCHFKCSGLKTLVAEAIRNTNGLKWCCHDCYKIDAEFYRFYQSTKNTFINLQKKLSVLSDEIAAYGNLFDDFKQLKILQSPVSSPKRRKSARNKNKVNIEPASSQNSANQLKIAAVSSLEQIQSHNNATVTPTLDVASIFSIEQNQNQNNAALTPALDSANNVVIAREELSVEDAPGPSNSIRGNVPTAIAPRQLTVVPPNRRIFVSRLAYDTTIEDVQYYISSKLDISEDILITKFSYSQPRSITSFKIAVPAHLYDCIVNPGFWPANIYVREFVFKDNRRSKNIARLPSGNLPNQKN